MKEKIINQIKNVKRTHLIMGAIALALIVATSVMFPYGTSQAVETAILSRAATSTVDRASLIATVGGDDISADPSMSSRNSWPAEIISSAISSIQPQREGIIVEWNVRIGDAVRKGDVIGRISAPPATPELVKMLAEQAESTAGARSKAQAALTYMSASAADSVSTGLGRLRENELAREKALRSFLERSLSKHVALTTYFQTWRDVRYGSFSLPYGSYDPALKQGYEEALVKLVERLKTSPSAPIIESEKYFDIAVKLVSGSVSEGTAYDFQTVAKDDQKDFYAMLSEYREAQAEAADKEAEYRQMIREADAADRSYDIVKDQITAGSSIVAPREGTISAIYGKVGDLVKPDMAVAVIAGDRTADLTVRMHIPNNIRKPSKGDVLSVVRPGFGNDAKPAKIVGTGLSLDTSGSYMADAEFIEPTDWPIGSSVRVISPDGSNALLVKASALWWSKDGIPHVWVVSGADRIYAKDIKIGRTLNSSVEVYEGLKKGDKYIAAPISAIHEDAMVSDIVSEDVEGSGTSKPAKSSGHGSMPGMEM